MGLWFIIIPLAVMLNACHLISTPEVLLSDSEISDVSDSKSKEEWAKSPHMCQRSVAKKSDERSPFAAWWEGDWVLDHQRLTLQLAQVMSSPVDDPNIKAISESLSSAFSVHIQAHQASLSIDGEPQRLATTPLANERGVRLIGGRREITIWCEGQSAFWRSESGESFPIRLVE